jgi:hypothetical protein
VEQEFDARSEAWYRANIRDYSFTYTPECMCRGTNLSYQVEVRDNKVVRFEHHSVPVSLSVRDLPHPTIDSLFAWLRYAYVGKAVLVRVAYDSVFHFPSKVMIDWSTNIIDDEFAFEVRGFRPIRAVGLSQR